MLKASACQDKSALIPEVVNDESTVGKSETEQPSSEDTTANNENNAAMALLTF